MFLGSTKAYRRTIDDLIKPRRQAKTKTAVRLASANALGRVATQNIRVLVLIKVSPVDKNQ